MTLLDFFTKHPVFTLDDLRSCHDLAASSNTRSREAILSYHVRQGRLVRVRKGLYAMVPTGGEPAACPVNPYLVAAKLSGDAVLAYHTALEVYGKAYSVFERYTFQSGKPLRPVCFRNLRFDCALFPKALREAKEEHFATVTVERSGLDIRVATLERTLVDVLDRPDLGGGWEEIWRSLEMIEYFDLDLVVDYVCRLHNGTTAAKVGYYLQQHARLLMVEDKHLDRLRVLLPKQPHYLERGKGGRFVREWNLVVPTALAERRWEEVS